MRIARIRACKIATAGAASDPSPAVTRPAMKATAFNSSGMIMRRLSMTAIASINPAKTAPATPTHPGAAVRLATTATAPPAPMREASRAPARAKRWLRLCGDSAVTAQVERGR